jgi:hypothetical protein
LSRGRARKAEAHHRLARRLTRMVDESPALPLLVRADGRIEGPSRLAGWLGLDAMPGYLSELDAGDASDRGLNEVQLSQLSDAVRRAQKTGAAFRMVLTPRGGTRCLAVRGHLADPQVSPAVRRWCGSSISATAKPSCASCARKRPARAPISPAFPA